MNAISRPASVELPPPAPEKSGTSSADGGAGYESFNVRTGDGGRTTYPAPAPLTKIFDAKGDHAALKEAEAFLKARGFLFGEIDGAKPIAVMLGGFVPKWRYIEPEGLEWLHGRLDSINWRAGPVTLRIRKDAPSDVLEAFHSNPQTGA